MRYYFGEIVVSTGDIEEPIKMVFHSSKKGVKGAFKKFAKDFYADTSFDRDDGVYRTEYVCHTEVDYYEIPAADFHVLRKYLPCHEI